jgi:hypothetical protein
MKELKIQKTNATGVALAVIRGEIPLSALSEIGVQVSCQEDGCKLDSKVTEVLSTPLVADLAQGLLTYQADSDNLRLWAFFILAESSMINLAEIELHPQGEVLMEALWDASSFGSINEDTRKVAESLASTLKPRWK